MAMMKCQRSVTKVKVKKEINYHANLCTQDFTAMCANLWGNPSAPPPPREEPMGTTFTRLPFAFPKSQENSEIVNRILHYSLRQQRDEDISGCSAFVSHVISFCLKAVNIQCRIESGNLDTGSETHPYMWLIINDLVIDNCYVKMMSKETISLIEKQHPKCYKTAKFSYSNLDLVCLEKGKIITVKTKKLIDLFNMNVPKAFTLSLNREDLNNYFFTMIRFMWDEYHVNITGIDPGIRFICWKCGKHPPLSNLFLNDTIVDEVVNEASADDQATAKLDGDLSGEDAPVTVSVSNPGWKFAVCGRCKVANYCSQTCQSLDWKNDHKFTCQTRSSIMLLPSDVD